MNLQGEALPASAEVSSDAAPAEEAVRRFEQKGNVVSADRARRLLEELRSR